MTNPWELLNGTKTSNTTHLLHRALGGLQLAWSCSLIIFRATRSGLRVLTRGVLMSKPSYLSFIGVWFEFGDVFGHKFSGMLCAACASSECTRTSDVAQLDNIRQMTRLHGPNLVICFSVEKSTAWDPAQPAQMIYYSTKTEKTHIIAQRLHKMIH